MSQAKKPIILYLPMVRYSIVGEKTYWCIGKTYLTQRAALKWIQNWSISLLESKIHKQVFDPETVEFLENSVVHEWKKEA